MGRWVACAAAAMALSMTGGASAQGVPPPEPGAPFPPPAPDIRYPPLPPAPMQPVPGSRWGGEMAGRWWGGAHAPGGWAAYRLPQRGWRLPPYWVTPRFEIADWADYGLAPPRRGRFWTRYYDDAVLIDDRGRVHDRVGGLDWNRAYGGSTTYGSGDSRSGSQDMGYGGATAYGSGDSRRGPQAMGYGAPAPGYPLPPGQGWVSPDGRTTVTVTTGGAAPVYAGPGYGYGYGYGYGGSVVTVTVQSAPAVTTTTTEYVEDRRVRARPAVRRPAGKRLWRRR